MDAGSVAQILKVAAPILMGVLGKQAKQSNVNSASGIEGLLGGLLKGNSPQQEQSFLESILDADGDGSVIDDVAGMVLGGGQNKKSGLGGLLGGTTSCCLLFQCLGFINKPIEYSFLLRLYVILHLITAFPSLFNLFLTRRNRILII